MHGVQSRGASHPWLLLSHHLGSPRPNAFTFTIRQRRAEGLFWVWFQFFFSLLIWCLKRGKKISLAV